MTALRNLRRELWLTIATHALDRALNNCRTPEDERTIRAIAAATQALIVESEPRSRDER